MSDFQSGESGFDPQCPYHFIEKFLKESSIPNVAISYDHRYKKFQVLEIDDGAYDPGYWGNSIEEAINAAIAEKKNDGR